MNTRLKLTSCALALVGTLSANAQITISEVLFNEVGSDVGGEWIEIYNKGLTVINLSNYKIGDEETKDATSATEGLWQFPSGATINPGQVQIVAVSATRFQTVYGFLPTYELAGTDATVPDLSVYSSWDPDGGNINMSNSNDQALLLDENDALVDGLNWGNTTYLNPGLGTALDGASYQRINAMIDTDTAADWMTITDSNIPAAQRSSPGVVVVPEPGSLALTCLGIAALVFRRKN
jgi:hypothetical protein